MHVISFSRLREFGKRHADSQNALDNWFKVASRANWMDLLEVQSVFPTAEAVEEFTIFNIKGNHYRLIVSIDYEKQLIYIKYTLTHADYDKEKWKDDPYFRPDPL